MKKFCLFIVLVCFYAFNAQESQEVLASKWKSGAYQYYRVSYMDDREWMANDDKFNVVVKKNVKNKIKKINLKGEFFDATDFVHLDSSTTDFVRHYSSVRYEDTKLYFTDNCIIVYGIKSLTPKLEIELKQIIGQKPAQTIKEEIVTYLEKSINYSVPKNISKSSQIGSITAVILSGSGELSSGTYVDIGIILKTAWGIEVKTKNLGGNLDSKNLNISCQFEKYTSTNTVSKFSWKVDCSKLSNKELEVTIAVATEPEVKFKSILPVKCDSENSPVVKLSKGLNEYDEIKYMVMENGKQVFRTLKKLPETGYSIYPLNLLEISKIKDVETNLIRVKKDNKIGYIDKDAKVVIPIEFDDGTVDNFVSGLIGVKKGDKCGFMTIKNKIGIAFEYDMVWPFNGAAAKIKSGGKFGLINQQGKLIAHAIYDEIWDISYGVFTVKKEGKIGYINEIGLIISKTIYDNAYNFNAEGFGNVILNSKHGCIDKTGKIVVPIEFENAPITLNSSLFKVYKNEKFGIMKKDGKMLFDYTYDEISVCGTKHSQSSGESDKYIRVKKGGLFGFVTTDGKVFKECIYTTADDFYGNMASITKNENGVEKKGHLLLTVSDGKGNINKSGYENLEEIEVEKEELISNTSSGKSKTKATSDKKTVKNTGKGILHMGADGSTGYSVNGGGTVDFPCGKKVYYTFYQNNGYNGRGPVISEAKQDCGQTINANGDQYNKK